MTLAVEEDRRAAILDAAVAVVVERGYGAARVSDIAERAGTSTGTVHYYFPTKVDVLDAALQHASDRSNIRHRSELASLSDPRERLLRLIDLQLPDGPVADEWAVWLEFWNEARHREELRERNREVYDRWVGLIESIVRDGVTSGQFRGDVDPADFALRFAGLFDGLGIQVLLQPSLDNRWRLRQLLVSMVERDLDRQSAE
jgi:AcrR family transcriptional regulator